MCLDQTRIEHWNPTLMTKELLCRPLVVLVEETTPSLQQQLFLTRLFANYVH